MMIDAIDGTHIPIDESASDYYNRKGYYPTIMQPMVDFCGLFEDVHIGWPDKVHNAHVFSTRIKDSSQQSMASTLG